MSVIDVFQKITGTYLGFLMVASVILNPIILFVCIRSKKLRSNSTFKLLAYSSLNDLLNCLGWNMDDFIFSFFNIRISSTNLIYCRVVSVFLQCATIQFSSWMLVSISLDRLLSISIKKWSKYYFRGYRPLLYAILLTLVILGLNSNMIVFGGFSYFEDGVEIIYCFATPPDQTIDWYKIANQVLF